VKVVVINGNIGSGKTSVLDMIKGMFGESKNGTVIQENVADWGYYLNKFYTSKIKEEKENYCYKLHFSILYHFACAVKQVEMLKETLKDGSNFTVFIERSPYDVREIFLDLNRGNINQIQSGVLMTACNLMYQDEVWKNATYIFLEAEPELCKDRIEARGRQGEENISIEYLNKLDENYRGLFDRLLRDFGENRVIKIKVNNKMTVKEVADVVENVMKVAEY